MGFLRAYYCYIFLYEFIFGYAIYTAYFRLQGLTASEIGLVLSLWGGFVVLLELPSGALSDRSDRRILLLLAPLIKSGCFITWIYAGQNVWLYALGFLFWAAGSSLKSGTKEALLYEHIQNAKLGRWYERLLGRERFFSIGGVMLGSMVGGLIGHFSMNLALALSVLPLFLASIIGTRLVDVRSLSIPPAANTDSSYLANFKQALQEFKKHPQIRFITVYVSVGLTLLGALEEFEQLLYLTVSLPVWAYGFVIAVASLLQMLASANAFKLSGIRSLSWLSLVLSGVLLVFAGVASGHLSLLVLILAYVVIAPLDVLADASLQRSMSGQSRATTTSAFSLCVETAAIFFTLVLGMLIDVMGLLAVYQLVGLYLFAVALWAGVKNGRGFNLGVNNRYGDR